MSMVFACLGASAQDANDRMPHEIQLPQPVEAPPRAKYKFDLSNKSDSVEKGKLPSKGLELDTRPAAPGTGGVGKLPLEGTSCLGEQSTRPLGRLSAEAAKQHRQGIQADYFPKVGLTLSNFHFDTFMGQEIQVQGPIAGRTAALAVPLLNKKHPPGTSPWGMRLQIAFLFPKLSKEMQEMLLQKELNPLQQEQPQEN